MLVAKRAAMIDDPLINASHNCFRPSADRGSRGAMPIWPSSFCGGFTFFSSSFIDSRDRGHGLEMWTSNAGESKQPRTAPMASRCRQSAHVSHYRKEVFLRTLQNAWGFKRMTCRPASTLRSDSSSANPAASRANKGTVDERYVMSHTDGPKKLILTIEFDDELDGRWIGTIGKLVGVHVYGETQDQAHVQAVAIEVLASEI